MSALGLITALSLGQFCPSYTLSSSGNTQMCGVESATGTPPTTAQWQGIFQLVAQGPAGWGSSGPSVPNIGQGCGQPMPTVSVPAKFPCELLKAIAWRESTWQQFCIPTEPSDQAGLSARTIIARDCGYGVGQVTSGMHIGEAPGFDRARVASDPTYNLATGTRILAEKWRITQCVGDNQPSIIEHWYSATWAYNGLASSNNPNNPSYSTTRGVYRPSVGGSAPYQEKVFGAMEYPPSAAHWTSVPFAYPRLSDLPAYPATRPNALPDPSCATPTSCASTRPTHVSACFQTTSDAGVGGGGGSTGGGGGATGGGGGSMTADSGTGGGDPDAGIDVPPVTLSRVHDALGKASGCGCDSAPTLWALISLGLFLRRRGR